MCQSRSRRGRLGFVEERRRARETYDKKMLAIGRLRHYTGGDSFLISKILIATANSDVVESTRKWCLLQGGSFEDVLKTLGVTVCVNGRRVSIETGNGTQEFVDDFFYSGLFYVFDEFIEATGLKPTVVYQRNTESLKSLGFEGTPQDASCFLAEQRDLPSFGTALAMKLNGCKPLALKKVDVCVNLSPVKVDGKKTKLNPCSLVTSAPENVVKIFDLPLDPAGVEEACKFVSTKDFRDFREFHSWHGMLRSDFITLATTSGVKWTLGLLCKLSKADFFRERFKVLSRERLKECDM